MSTVLSPARKRRRLSSPEVGDLSQEEIRAFDVFDAQLSQSSSSSQKNSQSGKGAKERRKRAIVDALRQVDESSTHKGSDKVNVGSSKKMDASTSPAAGMQNDPDNPFSEKFPPPQDTIHYTSYSDFTPAFQLASCLATKDLGPSSPEEPPERDYSAWFDSGASYPQVGFRTAKSMSLPGFEVNVSATGFMKASTKGWLAPKEASLEIAKEKMKIWQEDEVENMPALDSTFEFAAGSAIFSAASSLSSPQRPALRAIQSCATPATPTPSGFTHASLLLGAADLGKGQKNAFRSPLLPVRLSPPSHAAFPSLQVDAKPSPQKSVPSPASQYAGITGSSSVVESSFKLPAMVQGKMHTPSRFVTPFKLGMKPGEPGKTKLAEKVTRFASPTVPSDKTVASDYAPTHTPVVGKTSLRVFYLSKSHSRHTLASSGLIPQAYSDDDLESIGINLQELAAITPTTARYYSFHTPSSTPLSLNHPTSTLLGPAAVLERLLASGRWLATKSWVDNHWDLILWKLAGMVMLDPIQESDPSKKRWCWKEVMRQFFYRYELELNSGSRPPLRLISTQDAPPSCPMVLCISNIRWSEGGVAEDGTPIEQHPELEVTDGWYRLRAQVDEPMARAIRRGFIRTGRKIAVAGARLSSERKEPMEILEAYNSVKLVFTGNSSHMAPWHARLGFQLGPYISTLNSLTPDGGSVAVMDLVVTKIHPVGFLEFFQDTEGQQYSEGPRCESEEAVMDERWQRRREVEAEKLREELEKRLIRYESYADRLERQLGAEFQPTEDDNPPDRIEAIYDELDDPNNANTLLTRLKATEAGWLARCIRERIVKERERASDEMERELDERCPPRQVLNFRVLHVQDACTRRRPANRTAVLTVWNVLSLTFSEGGKPGSFDKGQRYQVTNLTPKHLKAWMDCSPGSEVYLCTNKDSRWTRLKS